MRELLFIVNASSGGRRGRSLLAALRARMATERVLEFGAADLAAAAARCRDDGAALVACGGDGTVAAVLEAAWRGGARVPVGIIPLGTGNDLAKTLGWSSEGGASGREATLTALRAARVRELDRWVLRQPPSSPSAPPGPGGGDRAWFNYISVGYDARVAHRFHALRRDHPQLFRSARVNKALYGLVSFGEGGRAIAPTLRLHGAAPIAVPRWSAALVIANIASWAGGTRLGAAIRPDDQRLDAFALPAGLAMGLAMGGIRCAKRLGAHRQLDLHLAHALAMQIDGEPILAAPGHYQLIHGGTVQVLVPSPAS